MYCVSSIIARLSCVRVYRRCRPDDFYYCGFSTCVASCLFVFFFFQAEDGIRDLIVTGVQTCALPICRKMQTGQGLVAGGRYTEPPLSFFLKLLRLDCKLLEGIEPLRPQIMLTWY